MPEQYAAMTDREIDAAVAERVMGWIKSRHDSEKILFEAVPPGKNYSWFEVPHYSTDDDSVRLVRNRIAELGLVREIMHVLWRDGIDPWWDCEFRLMQLTPRQQCEAALAALDARRGGGG